MSWIEYKLVEIENNCGVVGLWMYISTWLSHKLFILTSIGIPLQKSYQVPKGGPSWQSTTVITLW